MHGFLTYLDGGGHEFQQIQELAQRSDTSKASAEERLCLVSSISDGVHKKTYFARSSRIFGDEQIPISELLTSCESTSWEALKLKNLQIL